jgi:hypothetical protein
VRLTVGGLILNGSSRYRQGYVERIEGGTVLVRSGQKLIPLTPGHGSSIERIDD